MEIIFNDQNVYHFEFETIYLKKESPEVDLFMINVKPNITSQRHVDLKYDQFYYFIKGTFNISTLIGGNIRNTIIKPGMFVYIPKGLTYQISTFNEEGLVFGGFTPGGRFQLVKELAAYQDRVGVKNIDLNVIRQLESKYCVYEV